MSSIGRAAARAPLWGPSFTINAYYIQNRKKVSMTKQQREDRARICAQLGITKEQYDEVDRACRRAARRITRDALRRSPVEFEWDSRICALCEGHLGAQNPRRICGTCTWLLEKKT